MLWKAEWKDPSTQRHGRKGQSQYGVDVYGEPKKNHWSGIQCKGKDNYSSKQVTVSELRLEVQKAQAFTPLLDVFSLATTAPRDASIQAEARRLTAENRKRGLFSVHVVSWDDICELLDLHEDVFAKCYPGSPVNSPTHTFKESILGLQEAVLKHQQKTSRALDESSQVNRDLLRMLPKGESIDASVLLGISPEQLREFISAHRAGKQNSKDKHRARATPSVKVLSPERNHALGILAVSRIPFTSSALSDIFPDINWRTQLRYLRRHNLVELREGKYEVPASVARSLAKNDEDRLPFIEAWIEALGPLKWHPDTAFFLAMHQLSVGTLQESIETLVEAAVALLPGDWNDTYLSVLLQVDGPELRKLLSTQQRVAYLNSVGLCLYRAKRYEESIEWFKRLRTVSKRVQSNWGIGQSFHHCGIVYVELGDFPKAEDCFRKAVAHSRKTRDRFLLGRSLYELAIVISGTSEEEARKLLQESECAKKKVKDQAGLVGVNHGQAVLAIHNGNYKEAIQWFRKAAAAARSVGHYHAEALERYNIGRCYIDLGEDEKALPHLLKARKLAEDDELADVIQLTYGGEAMALANLHRYKQAEKVFRKLFVLHQESGETTSAAVSLHDIGATFIGQKKYDEARKELRRAAQYARQHRVSDWLYQSLADIARSYILEGKVDRGINWLVATAAKEADRKHKDLAAKLWIDALEFSSQYRLSNSATSKAVAECRKLARSKKSPGPLRAQLLSALHLWHWHDKDYTEGLKVLSDLLSYAKDARDRELICRAQDQIGVCLQELNRIREAVSAHRAALRAAKRLGEPDTTETSLNNLSEALRKLGGYTEAIALLAEAESSARERDDIEAAISYAHNRALSLELKGGFEEAEGLFKACRDEARQHKYWHEYVRALHALANLAWHGNKPALALRRYSSALKAVDKYGANSRHAICLNYANALRWKDQPERALRVLRSAEADFSHLPDAHLYHSQLAILYDELGKKRQAREQWELSYVSAVRVGDDYAIALSAGALAEANDDIGELEKADAHYETAIKHEEDDALRMQLLVQRLGVSLQLGREDAAESVFEEIRTLGKNAELLGEYIDAHIMLGDYNWTEGNSPKEGIKAYLAAMAACVDNHFDRYCEVGALLTMRLAHVKGRNKKSTLSRLKDSTIRWLEDAQGIGEDDEELKFLLWPFLAALRLLKSGGSNAVADEEKFASILEEEVGKALG